MSEQIEFLSVPLAGGGEYVRLDRLTDGRVMCQLCFGFFEVADLNPVDGGVEDVCKTCAAVEAEMVRRKAAGEPSFDKPTP